MQNGWSGENKKIIDTRDGQKIPKVECVLADETATAKGFFKGENAQFIEKSSIDVVSSKFDCHTLSIFTQLVSCVKFQTLIENNSKILMKL